MADLLYTTTDEVSAALGFDSFDLAESLLVAANLDLQLEYDLDDWLPNHATIWAEGDPGGTPTAEQTKKRNVLELYSQWCIAWMVARKRPLYIQIYTDGKTQMNRYDFDLQEVIDMCAAEKNKWMDLLLELEDRQSEIDEAIHSPVAISPPDFDPITGA